MSLVPDTVASMHKLIQDEISKGMSHTVKYAKRPAEMRAQIVMLRAALDSADVEATRLAHEREEERAREMTESEKLAEAHAECEEARAALRSSELGREALQEELNRKNETEKELRRELARVRHDLTNSRTELRIVRPFSSQSQNAATTLRVPECPLEPPPALRPAFHACLRHTILTQFHLTTVPTAAAVHFCDARHRRRDSRGRERAASPRRRPLRQQRLAPHRRLRAAAQQRSAPAAPRRREALARDRRGVPRRLAARLLL